MTGSNGKGVSLFGNHKYRALITGGAGFLGSHLAEALLKEGHEVLVLDDLSTGNVTNIQHLKQNGHFRYWIDALANRSLLAELVDESDMVFHLAAAVGVRLIVESPVHTVETNVNGTELVLKAATKKKKPVFIASTSEVYGKSTQVPFREDDDVVLGRSTKGRWSYAASKLLDEFLALAYWKEKKLPVFVVRFFNIVGPRQSSRYEMAYEQGFEDMQRRVPSLEKIAGLIGWQPVTSLDACIDLVALQLKQRTDMSKTQPPPSE